MTCTSLDHVYPATVPGTPCYCGRRTWADAPRISRAALTVGARVLVLGAEAVIVGKERGEDIYRIDRIIRGRSLFDRDELQAV